MTRASAHLARSVRLALDLEQECERLTGVAERLAEENERLRERLAAVSGHDPDRCRHLDESECLHEVRTLAGA